MEPIFMLGTKKDVKMGCPRCFRKYVENFKLYTVFSERTHAPFFIRFVRFFNIETHFSLFDFLKSVYLKPFISHKTKVVLRKLAILFWSISNFIHVVFTNYDRNIGYCISSPFFTRLDDSGL